MIYTIATQKGGTAKTTTAAVIAQAAAYRGRRALAIDLDPQGNLSFATGADARRAGSYELLHGATIEEVTQTTAQGIDVITASPNLRTETSSRGSARRLQNALTDAQSMYDVITIDTPATAGELQYNALQAADRLIIVLEADAYCIQSLYQIDETTRQIQQSNPGLTIAGVLLAKYDGRANFTKAMRDRIEQTAAAMGAPFLGTVRAGIAIKEAAGLQVSLYEYAPKSNPAADYLNIYDELERQDL